MQRKKKQWSLWYWFGPFVIRYLIAAFVTEIAYLIIGGNASRYAIEITTITAGIVLIVLCIMYRKDRAKKTDVKKLEGKTYIFLIVLAVASCIALNISLIVIPVKEMSDTYQSVARQMYSSPAWIQFLGLGIFIPAMEEMLYRGLLYRRMREVASVTFSVTFTAVLFGVAHGNLVQFLFASILGILLGVLFEVWGSVKAPIVFHVSVNLTSLIFTKIGTFGWVLENNERVILFLFVSIMIVMILCVKMKKVKM